jgi:hypothetical protein
MKNVLHILFFSLFFIYGCEKEYGNFDEYIMEDSVLETRSYNIDGLIEIANLDLVSQLESLNTNTPTDHLRSPKHASANGHFITPLGTSVIFSAIENKGGIHGQIRFNNETLNLNMETSCVSTFENTAIFQGIITATNSDGPLSIGNRLIFYVIDNGSGKNSPLDQYSQNLYSIPPNLTGGNEILYDCEFWMSLVGEAFPLISDVASKREQIRVK